MPSKEHTHTIIPRPSSFWPWPNFQKKAHLDLERARAAPSLRRDSNGGRTSPPKCLERNTLLLTFCCFRLVWLNPNLSETFATRAPDVRTPRMTETSRWRGLKAWVLKTVLVKFCGMILESDRVPQRDCPHKRSAKMWGKQDGPGRTPPTPPHPRPKSDSKRPC